MNYDFFADKNDKIQVLEFIFEETDLRVFDQYSPPGEEVCEYKNAEEIAAKFDLENGAKFVVAFHLWAPSHGREPWFEQLSLNPKYCNGHTFRFTTRGLGMIQLYFGGIKDGHLSYSHLGHFNEKGAAAVSNDQDHFANWDWKEIAKTSRKIQYHIQKKLAVDKIGSTGVLPGADKLAKQGIVLR